MRIFLLSLFLFSQTLAAKADIFNADSFMLSNGLQVVVIENHRAPVVTQMMWYKTGSIDDPLGKSGIAHLLEHMMFKGTAAVPDGEFSKIIARNGGTENAFTSLDYTAYYQNIARDRLELVMFLESDRMKNLRFLQKDFDPELEVVKEERLMRTENNPAALLNERRNSALWGEHPYGRPVIGTKKELSALTLNDVKRFYRTHYAPDNAVLVVAGDITAAMPYRAMTNIINFIQAMDQVVPGFASQETLLYSPELKFYSNRVKMDENLNTNVKGLHCLGDSSGWTRGLMMASVMGVIMGRHLAEEK